MMANSSNIVTAAPTGAKAAATRKATAPVDDRRPICGNAGPAPQDDGDSFSARLQDAANARRDAAANTSKSAAEKDSDSSSNGKDETAAATPNAASADAGATTADAAAAAADAAAAAVAAAANATQRAAGELEINQDCAARDAAALAAQLQVLAGSTAAEPAPGICAAPAPAAGNVGINAAGSGTGADAQNPPAEGAQRTAGATFSMERYARELERAATTPLPTIEESSKKTATDSKESQPQAVGGVTGNGASMTAALQTLADNLALRHSPAEIAPRSLEASVGSKAWQEQLGGQLSWMIDRGEQLATLRLSPEHLGPLEVKISVRESEATVWFGAAQPETRAALEQAMPRLRDMLASQGIALTQSGVSSGSSGNPQRGSTAASRFGGAALLGDEPATEVKRTSNRGLVDLYA